MGTPVRPPAPPAQNRHQPLSALLANVISDVGGEALAGALVGYDLMAAKDEQHGGYAPSRSRGGTPAGLKTLDLGQVRKMQ